MTSKIEMFASWLERITPQDAGTQERYDKHWKDACQFAAERAFDIIELSARDGCKIDKRDEARIVAKEGMRIRSEYLAQAR